MPNDNIALNMWWPEFVQNMHSDGLSDQEILNFLMKMYLEKDLSIESVNEMAKYAKLKIDNKKCEYLKTKYIKLGSPILSRSSFDENGDLKD